MTEFLAVATAKEHSYLEESRKQVIGIFESATKASRRKDQGGSSMAETLKRYWAETSEVVYDYAQMLDVMVGQAPEFVALAYGAVKILLAAQVNYEELKRKVKEYMEQIQLKFKIIDHLTVYIPSSHLVAMVGQAYSLFYLFMAKAVKYYTQSRLS